jgi:signal transduction histidine kinase
MTSKIRQLIGSELTATGDRVFIDKQVLALNALSKLARQFSNRPDFIQLVDVLLLTLSGQFSVANVFATLHKPDSQSTRTCFFATGKFKNDSVLPSLEITDEVNAYFLDNKLPQPLSALPSGIKGLEDLTHLADAGVIQICPMIHNDRTLGLIGLGAKVTGKPFTQEDLDLFSTIVSTITPFVASSYHFMEMATLSAWYLNILNSVKMGVFVFDGANRLKKVNRAGFNILKTFSPDLDSRLSLYGAPIQDVFLEAVFGDWSRQFIKARQEEHNQVIENMKAGTDKIECIFNVRLSRILTDTESTGDLIVTLDNVTSQKKSEQRLFELQQYAEKGVMASSISHELNNFLALILGGTEMTQLALSKGDTQKADANLEKLKSNVTKMERFTAGLMDYGKLKTAKDKAQLNTIIADILSFVTVQEKFKRVQIAYEFEPNLPEVELDADQIAQLLLNLLNNAADAIVEAQRDTGQIIVRTFAKDACVSLSVSDNGIGIKPEIKEKLFKSRLTTKKKGHGYGLVTCGKIVRNHQAVVAIDSEVNRGTTISISFPLRLPE